MPLPNANITRLRGGLGRAGLSEDGVAGLIVTGVAVAGKFALGDVLNVFDLEEAKALGITEAYDTANSCQAFRQVREFYDQALPGRELFLMVLPETVTLDQICEKDNVNYALKLVEAAQGRLRLLGVTRTPDGETPTIVNGLTSDLVTAIPLAQELAELYAVKHQPFSVLLEGRRFSGTTGNLTNFRTTGAAYNPRVSVVLASSTADGSASVGLALGRAAASPVQRNIGRVRSGTLGIAAAYLSSGVTVEAAGETQLTAIHDKGYIIIRTFIGKAGYFFNDDPTCCELSDDYSGLARNRVMDKAIRLERQVLLEEVNDDIDIDVETGKLPAVYIKALQNTIEQKFNTELIAKGEASAVTVSIDPNQNILSTDKLVVAHTIVPKGYTKYIEATTQYSNPFNAA